MFAALTQINLCQIVQFEVDTIGPRTLWRSKNWFLCTYSKKIGCLMKKVIRTNFEIKPPQKWRYPTISELITWHWNKNAIGIFNILNSCFHEFWIYDFFSKKYSYFLSVTTMSWWVEFDDELTWLFTNKFSAIRCMKVNRMWTK